MPAKPLLTDHQSIREFVARLAAVASDRLTLYRLVVAAAVVDLDILGEIIEEFGIA